MPNRVRLALYDSQGKMLAIGSQVKPYLLEKWRAFKVSAALSPGAFQKFVERRTGESEYAYLRRMAIQLGEGLVCQGFREQRGVRGQESYYYNNVLRYVKRPKQAPEQVTQLVNHNPTTTFNITDEWTWNIENILNGRPLR